MRVGSSRCRSTNGAACLFGPTIDSTWVLAGRVALTERFSQAAALNSIAMRIINDGDRYSLAMVPCPRFCRDTIFRHPQSVTALSKSHP